MRLLNLTVENFGVFRGRQSLDLEPSARNKGRNLTIVGGQNGAGKSTLFGAMALALHGSVALGDRVSRQAYNDFLLSRLHKGGASSSRAREREAGVALSLGYVRSGRPTRVEVERRWRSTGRRAEETLIVHEDGSPPEGGEGDDLQAWLDELVSPGLSPLCFFDAEKLNTLANPEQHDETLRDTVGRLLGLDLVGRLQEDLRSYTLSRGGGRLANRLRDEVLRHQADVEVLAAQLEKAEAEAKDLDENRAELEAELAKLERRLASEGGGYAAKLPAMHKRLEEVQAETEEVSERLRELCADLLPFALAPEGCETLDRSLDEEADRHRRRLVGELWEERVAGAESALRDEGLWEDLGLPADARAAISDRLLGALRAADGEKDGPDERPLVHQLSDQDHAKLKGWIAHSSDEVPVRATDWSERLRGLQAERKAVENDLQRTPDEDAIGPIGAEVIRCREALGKLGERRAQVDERLALLGLQREEKGRELERAAEKLAEAQSGERQMVLAERSKRALRAYEDALTRQQLTAVEEELVAAFNMVCRKEHLLSSARIDPENFRVRLHGADGGAFGLGDFSAGERQLYVMALLWALRRTSRRRLPLAVDTPLARLDEVHRHRLLHAYVPAVSEQVLLFTTDAELDSGVLAGVEPYLSRVYRLHQDAEEGYTEVRESERPEPRGVLLYDRIENGRASELEAAGAEIWVHDPEGSGTNGRRRKALLSNGARRLTLTDPVDGGYDWSRVAELERVTGASYVSGKLRSGARVGELWQGEWTEGVRKAGYDSVSAPGVKGTEEYVVNPDKVSPVTAPGEKNEGNA